MIETNNVYHFDKNNINAMAETSSKECVKGFIFGVISILVNINFFKKITGETNILTMHDLNIILLFSSKSKYELEHTVNPKTGYIFFTLVRRDNEHYRRT